jgi:hypothetical protein
MRTLLIAASLLTLGVLGTAPASACTSVAGQPGPPGGGVLGYAEWYAAASAHSACASGQAAQSNLVASAGDVQATAGMVVAGAAALVDAGGHAATATAYAQQLDQASRSQSYDACSALFGPDPACGGDPPVSQAQRCANGAGVPVTAAGGVVRGTQENLNGAVQATCGAASSAGGRVPSADETTAFAGASAGILAGEAVSSGGAIAFGTAGAAFGFADSGVRNTCVFLRGTQDCLP